MQVEVQVEMQVEVQVEVRVEVQVEVQVEMQVEGAIRVGPVRFNSKCDSSRENIECVLLLV